MFFLGFVLRNECVMVNGNINSEQCVNKMYTFRHTESEFWKVIESVSGYFMLANINYHVFYVRSIIALIVVFIWFIVISEPLVVEQLFQWKGE